MMAPLMLQARIEVDDNVSVATGATFSIITNPDGIRCCRKHPHMQLKDGMFACPICDSDFLQSQAMLKQKKDLLRFNINRIEEEEKKESNTNSTMMVLRSQHRPQNDEVAKKHDFNNRMSSFPSTMAQPSLVVGYSTPPQQQTNHSSFPTAQQQRQQYPLDAFTMQMQRMQQMQDWMLMKKEKEAQTLRKKLEEQNQVLHQNAIQLALLKEKYQYQEDRMKCETKLLRDIMAHKRENSNKKGKQWQQEPPFEPSPAQSLPASSADFTAIPEHPSNKVGEKLHITKPRNTTQLEKGGTSCFKMIGTDIDVDDAASSAVPSNEELTLATLMQRQISWISSKGGDRFKPRYIPQATLLQQNNDEKVVADVTSSSTNIYQNECHGNKKIKQKMFKDHRDNRTDLNTLLEDQSVAGKYTVASSTYGEDRFHVEDKSIVDPFGNKCNFTGPILKSTLMPHGKGKMIYKKDKERLEGQWRHGRLHGF